MQVRVKSHVPHHLFNMLHSFASNMVRAKSPTTVQQYRMSLVLATSLHAVVRGNSIIQRFEKCYCQPLRAGQTRSSRTTCHYIRTRLETMDTDPIPIHTTFDNQNQHTVKDSTQHH
jgi:hypothetical protein